MIEEKTHKKFGETKIWLEDTETGSKYRRISCGIGWPFGESPGFVVVLAEDYTQDFQLEHNPRHLRILAEYEEHALERLHRKVLEYKKTYCTNPIIADKESSTCKIFSRIGSSDDRIDLTPPQENIGLNFISQSIYRHTKNRKTLHFTENSRLPGYIAALAPNIIQENNMELSPAISALGYTLGHMDMTSPSSGIFRPRRKKYI